jgi:hypothetical protein
MKGKLPPETKRAAVGLILWVLGCIFGGAVFFYLMYSLRIAFRHRH